MKREVKDIIKDVVENIKGYETTIKNVGSDYYKYDRSKWIQKFFVDGEIMREVDDEIYETDIETISILILQQYLFQQQIFEDEYNGEVIDRFERRSKMKITENDMMIDDKKIVESFVWYCFGKLSDEEIHSFIQSFKDEVVEHFKETQLQKNDVESEDEDMNRHNIQKIEKETESQKVKVNTTLTQFTDRMGFSKNDWKRMLEL